MRTGNKIILFSFIAGLLVFVIDTLIDTHFFFEEKSILDTLTSDISRDDLYFRLFLLVSFVIFGIAISRIMHKQKKLEEQIVQAKNDWEETFNSMSDIITIHDSEFNIIRANKAAETTLGHSFTENIINMKCYTCYHGTDSAPEECPSCESLNTGRPAVFEKYEPFLKKYIEIRTMPRIAHDGKVTGLIHIVRDMTKHRENEEALLLSEEKFRSIVETTNDWIWEIDRNGFYTYVSPTVYDILGYKPKEIIGKTPFDLMPVEEAVRVRRIFAEIAWSQEPLSLLVNINIHKNGHEVVLETSGVPFFDSDGQLLGYRGIDRDVTERKKIEKELTRHREQLMEMVKERTSELQKINEQLVKEIEDRKLAETEAVRASHLAALGELAAGVAHEINNPINGIINYSQILANRSDPGSSEHEISSRIIKEGDRIASIVKSLLSFARDSREEKYPSNVSDIMSDSLGLTETYLRKEGIRLMVEIPPYLPMIVAHPQQIEQVFLNIISNARYSLNEKYSGENENKILEILVECIDLKDDHYIRVTFYDRGTGIPRKIIDKVLNPFFTTKPSNLGTGLGLSISHGIISDHGGEIIIESIEGEYTKIIVEVPVIKQNDSDLFKKYDECDLKK